MNENTERKMKIDFLAVTQEKKLRYKNENKIQLIISQSESLSINFYQLKKIMHYQLFANIKIKIKYPYHTLIYIKIFR